MILQLTNQLQIEGEEKRKLHVVIEEQESLYAELKEKCSSLESKWNDQFLSIPQRVINSASVCLLKEYNGSLLS